MLLSMTSRMDSIVQFLTVLVIFVFVLGVTVISTRYIAGIQKDKYKTGNMELIETLRISNNKYLQIVRVGDKYICMAVCKDTVTLLGEIQKEEMFLGEENMNTHHRFLEIFEKIKKESFRSTKQDTNEENRR